MAKTKVSKIASKIDDLAEMIADQALGCEDPDTQLEAFKLLTAYYIGTTKVHAKLPKENEDDGSFKDFQRRIEQAETGRA